ncbi:M15 family peptidase [Shewanella sp. NKUCC01_JLK]|uniref:M15 family peptidase n=1 Tax=unclassified Shewanella TaxID=196818 RepID=UPI00156332F7|nr:MULTISPECIES: M15 family peptidase [unclassified Shewanella]MBW3517460.1 M15 family peptidase [Shewanella sp. NKUCC01_JLK]NRD34563.1 M15 family peptidase [Shewanella sp. DC2-4]
MPKFSATSISRLNSCHPDLGVIFSEVIQSIDCSIFCGHRGQAEQDKAFANKLSQVQWPNSKHNSSPSMAVDAGPYFAELKNTSWDDAKAFALFAGYVKRVAEEKLKAGLITHRLRWGGDWDGDGRTLDQKFHDLPHFELIKV